MATAKKNEVIEIKPVQMETVTLTIVGDTPLIVHKWSEKARRELLKDTGRRTGMTVIIITHNSALTAMADRVIRVKNGTVSSVTLNEHPVDISEIEW